MQNSIICATFGWTKTSTRTSTQLNWTIQHLNPRPSKVIPQKGRWGIGLNPLPSTIKGCGVRTILHHMEHSPSARDQGLSPASTSKSQHSKKGKLGRLQLNKQGKKFSHETILKKKDKAHERRKIDTKMERVSTRKKHRKKNKKKKRRSKQSHRLAPIDNVSRSATHELYHRLRLEKIQTPACR